MNRRAKVVAVVVTWNRREILARNLRAVMAQSRPVDEVLVVDNASTDGTRDMLAVEFPKARVIRLSRNYGPAGSFFAGIDHVMKTVPDWLWLMDDDGVPGACCLSEQLTVAHQYRFDVCGSLVHDIADPARLAFPPPRRDLPATIDGVRRAGGTRGCLVENPYPWNGLLVNANVVEVIGRPKPEMFIWGEEDEYMDRAKANKLRVGIALWADYAHPRPNFPSRWFVNINIGRRSMRSGCYADPTHPRAMYHARNQGYRDWTYRGKVYGCARLLGVGAHLTLTRGIWAAAAYIRYYIDGARDRYQLDPRRDEVLSSLTTELSGA